MKIKSLLAAVSMAALLAPAANAIVVEQEDIDFVANTSFAQPLALELDLAGEPVLGQVVVTVQPDDELFFNQGVQHNVVVTLPAGMVFDDSNPTFTTPTITTNNDENGNIFSGGDEGDSTVTFQIAPQDALTGTFQLTLPVAVGSCLEAGSGINVTVETAGGFVNNDVDGDNTNSAMGAAGFGGCASAFDGTVQADNGDTFLDVDINPAYSDIDLSLIHI